MVPGQRPDAVRAEELRLVEHPGQHPAQPVLVEQREQPPAARRRQPGIGDAGAGAGWRAMKPARRRPGRGTARTSLGNTVAAAQRQQPDHRADLQRHGRCRRAAAARRRRSRPPRPTSRPGVEPARFIAAAIQSEVLEELLGLLHVTGSSSGQLERDLEHVLGRTAPSRRSRRPARGGRRSAAARSGRTRRCCPGRGSRPGRRCVRRGSLRLTHQVKFISSFWNALSSQSQVALAGAALLQLVDEERRPRRAPAG